MQAVGIVLSPLAADLHLIQAFEDLPFESVIQSLEQNSRYIKRHIKVLSRVKFRMHKFGYIYIYIP